MPAALPAVDWEHSLAEFLAELSQTQQELLDVLTEKRQHMVAGDVPGMTDLQPRETQLNARLEACQQRREELLQLAALHGKSVNSLEQLASHAPVGSRDKLRKQVKDAGSRLRILQHQSLTNWVLAQRSLLHLSQLLEIIATGGRGQPTYGTGDSHTARGALVDRTV